MDTDQAFAMLANKAGGIKPLLDSFFGFLHRKTDFYIQVDPTTNNPTMGFPPNMAQSMVMDAFSQYPFTDYSTQAPAPPPKAAAPTATATATAKKGASTTASSPAKATSAVKKTVPPLAPPQLNEKGKQIPIGNGGVADNYYWTQTLNELTVYIDVDNTSRGKDVKCTIAPKSLSLSVKDQPLVNGPLEDVVNTGESMWTISSAKGEGSSQVVISLEKTRKTWWKHIIIGHPEIDTSKVDSTQKIDEYDEETQATIRKLMFEQRQKRMLGETGETPSGPMIDDILPPSNLETLD